MIDLLVSTLSKLGLPVFRQGSLTEDGEYPSAFYTFWNPRSEGQSFYDNKETSLTWEFIVYYYTNNANTLEDGLNNAIDELRKADFIIGGKGFDVGSDEITHVGRAVRISKIERS